MYRNTVYLFRNIALMLPERPRGRGGICSALRACVNVTVQTTVHDRRDNRCHVQCVGPLDDESN
jgi:hypothetical protein